MHVIDPIDSLLLLFDNPSLEEQALNNFDKELTPLMEILEEIITRHIDTVRNRNQAKIIIGCLVLRNTITWYANNPTTPTGQGE